MPRGTAAMRRVWSSAELAIGRSLKMGLDYVAPRASGFLTSVRRAGQQGLTCSTCPKSRRAVSLVSLSRGYAPETNEFRLEVFVQAFGSAFAAETRFLHAAERHH